MRQIEIQLGDSDGQKLFKIGAQPHGAKRVARLADSAQPLS